jgi:hypothetical protein
MSPTKADSPRQAPKKINLNFRPATYFCPLNLQQHIQSHVKGAIRREVLMSAIARNEMEGVVELLDDLPEQLKEFSRIEPSFLGGEFLPDRGNHEVEIARVTLDSCTRDVTSVYVRFEDGVFHYQLVDEYDGETLIGPSRRRSDRPLTLGDLVEFMDAAWPLYEALEMNFEGSLSDMLGFFQAESAFYPQLDALYRRRVRKAYREARSCAG